MAINSQAVFWPDGPEQVQVKLDPKAREGRAQRPLHLIGCELPRPKVMSGVLLVLSMEGPVSSKVRAASAPMKSIGAESGYTSLRDDFEKLLTASDRVQGELGDRLAALSEIIEERNLLHALIDQVPDQLFIKDKSLRFLVANNAVVSDKTFLDGQPMSAAALIGKSDFDLFPAEIAQRFADAELEIMQSGDPVTTDMRENIDGKGWSKWVSMTKVPIRNDKHEVIGLLGVGRDVTSRKQAEERVQFLAHHDFLTGLPNRALFADRLGQAILASRRDGGRLAVVFCDLDRFKMVNDSLGHLAGDTLLTIAAGRMVGCLRSTDTVARLGGDEFVILLNDVGEGPDGVMRTIEKVRSSLSERVDVLGQEFTVTTSIGVATFPDNGHTAEELLTAADAAMYRAKELGRDNVQFHSSVVTTSAASKRLQLAEGLRRALANDEFVLHYQPQIDLKSGKIFAVEALIRWQHPELGLLSPDAFIGLAEETGLIVPIGRWVIKQACAQNAVWQAEGMRPIAVSVNVSARQFGNNGLVDDVRRALEQSGLAASYLDLELTESMIMQDLGQAIKTMKDLEALGVRLSIDDFGTGYSSLSALKSFPIARLKIDRSFVAGLSSDEGDRAIATAVISLGQKLNLRVIAEGVESDEQLKFLTDNGCDEVQGFKFSKPIAPADVVALMKRQVS
ncbi:MAG: EAL domain-containing protein [Devosia sp.]